MEKYFYVVRGGSNAAVSSDIGARFSTKEEAIESAKQFLMSKEGQRRNIPEFIILENVAVVRFPMSPIEVLEITHTEEED